MNDTAPLTPPPVPEQRHRHACHCCEMLTFYEDPKDTFNICPVCFWEHEYSDMTPRECSDMLMPSGGPNGVSLEQAKKNYKSFGACTERDLKHVRSPFSEEFPHD